MGGDDFTPFLFNSHSLHMIQVPPQTSDAGKAAVHRCKQLSLSISCPATSYFTFYMQIQKRDGNNSSGMVRADAWNTWDSSLTDSNGRCRYKAVNSIYVCPAYQSEVLVAPRHASVLCHLFRSWSLFHACEEPLWKTTWKRRNRSCWQRDMLTSQELTPQVLRFGVQF